MCDSYSVVVLVVVAGLLLSAVQTDRRCQCDSYSVVVLVVVVVGLLLSAVQTDRRCQCVIATVPCWWWRWVCC